MRRLFLLVVAVALVPGAAAAARRRDPCADIGAQRSAFLEALAKGRADEALLRITKIHEQCTSSTDDFAFGLAYEAKGLLDRAAESYEAYLRRDNGTSTYARNARERLEALKPYVVLVSRPESARVFIDDAREPLRTKTPVRLLLLLGAHKARFELDGFAPRETSVNVEPDGVREFSVDLLPIVRISSRPPGALAFLDAAPEPIGTTPFEAPVTLGPHAMRFELRGYSTAQHRFSVGERGGVSVHAELAPASPAEGKSGGRDLSTWRNVSLITGGSLGAGTAVLALLAQGRVDDRDRADTRMAWRDLDDEAGGYATAYYVTASLATTALIAGVTLWLIDR